MSHPEIAPGAKCPNHGCPLYKTDQPGVGICTESGWTFEYSVDDLKTGMKNEIRNGELVSVFTPLKNTEG